VNSCSDPDQFAPSHREKAAHPSPNHPADEDLSLHPSEQKSFVGDPESVGTLAAPTPTHGVPRSPDGAQGSFSATGGMAAWMVPR
jgi:hypothetical protein